MEGLLSTGPTLCSCKPFVFWKGQNAYQSKRLVSRGNNGLLSRYIEVFETTGAEFDMARDGGGMMGGRRGGRGRGHRGGYGGESYGGGYRGDRGGGSYGGGDSYNRRDKHDSDQRR